MREGEGEEVKIWQPSKFPAPAASKVRGRFPPICALWARSAPRTDSPVPIGCALFASPGRDPRPGVARFDRRAKRLSFPTFGFFRTCDIPTFSVPISRHRDGPNAKRGRVVPGPVGPSSPHPLVRPRRLCWGANFCVFLSFLRTLGLLPTKKPPSHTDTVRPIGLFARSKRDAELGAELRPAPKAEFPNL